MRLSRIALIAGVFAAAALLSLAVSWASLAVIETGSRAAVAKRLALAGADWAQVEANGLQIFVRGEAPDEHTRFAALSAAAEVIDPSRIVDEVSVRPASPVTPPRFSVEVLRNDQGVSLIGLVPASTDRKALAGRIEHLVDGLPVTDLLESADYPAPEHWQEALDYGLGALALLPKSKISVSADRVIVTGIAQSRDEKRRLEARLARAVPEGLRAQVDVAAPRPVITPFTLRFVKDASGAHFDACSAHSEDGRAVILAAASRAGLSGRAACPLGLGVPSPDWPQAVAAAIDAVDALGGGAVTFSDADITLVAPEGTPPEVFDRVTGELEADLPKLFSLHAVLPEPAKRDRQSPEAEAAPEFLLTLSPEGLAQLRGRLADERQRAAAQSLAHARLGGAQIHNATRLAEGLPDDWSVRVLAAIDALGELESGAARVTPDRVEITGRSGNEEASAEVSRLLAQALGEGQDFRVNVTYEKALDPVASLPTPEECAARIDAVMAEQKITFAPGSADMSIESRKTIDRIAEILRNCPEIRMEVAGYTDSQGRESMNRALSQSRAQAVLDALLARRVVTTGFKAVGYGEDDPIADNSTEIGREANRRIEFHLIAPSTEIRPDMTGAAEAQPTAEGAAPQAPPPRPATAGAGQEQQPKGNGQ